MTTREEVLRIAQLARIHLDDSEVEKVATKFTAVMEFFKFLSEAQTEGVVPMFHAAEKMELRADEPEAPLDREELLRNAPDRTDGCFRIPKVLGGHE
jgi:aspartyl-tRNA(Asn)/glutamyl-tRNA(Gln) amidotransferase subunit C